MSLCVSSVHQLTCWFFFLSKIQKWKCLALLHHATAGTLVKLATFTRILPTTVTSIFFFYSQWQPKWSQLWVTKSDFSYGSHYHNAFYTSIFKLTTWVFFVWLHFFRCFLSWSSNTVLYIITGKTTHTNSAILIYLTVTCKPQWPERNRGTTWPYRGIIVSDDEKTDRSSCGLKQEINRAFHYYLSTLPPPKDSKIFLRGDRIFCSNGSPKFGSLRLFSDLALIAPFV